MTKPSQTQDHIVTVPAPTHESTGSKIKNFFRKDKKIKVELSEEDARILEQVQASGQGLIPVAGDMITLAMALNLVRTAQKADIPRYLVRKMLFNIVIDFGFGLVPLLGDVADFVFKANDRNAKIFEEYLYARAAQNAEDAEAKAKKNHDSSAHTKEGAIPLHSIN
ncbi:hypothetical protein BG006_007104 [Podila minutissima]|uniref:DUF4112 domain-containing protein n=1 Tax=Podila minutissima TaxID=64525 RepID=A0A9P5SHM2_9FUNG|nr:hypothetical protein BG006_007104 [Podila minutissima]